jgi:hypothetical protein
VTLCVKSTVFCVLRVGRVLERGSENTGGTHSEKDESWDTLNVKRFRDLALCLGLYLEE